MMRQIEDGRKRHVAKSTWWLFCLAVERPWTVGRPLLFFFVVMVLENSYLGGSPFLAVLGCLLTVSPDYCKLVNESV